MATLGDVAQRAGVSVSAASRVLSNAPSARVSAATRERIRAAAAELDYRPNFAARALRSSRTHVIALMVPDITNAMFTGLMLGVDDAARERGYTVLLARAEGIEPQADTVARLVGEGRVDGLLVQLGDGTDPSALAALQSSGIPAVLINTTNGGGLGTLAIEDERGAALAVEHLAALGHRRIGFVGGVPTNDTAVRRAQGYRDAMAAAGLEPGLETQLGYAPEQGREALAAHWAIEPRPTALVVANVNAAMGVLGAAREQGIDLPTELSVVAIHDAWTAEYTWPPLTTVRMPLALLGRQAVAALDDRLAGEPARSERVDAEPPVLVVRGSTAPPAP